MNRIMTNILREVRVTKKSIYHRYIDHYKIGQHLFKLFFSFKSAESAKILVLHIGIVPWNIKQVKILLQLIFSFKSAKSAEILVLHVLQESSPVTDCVFHETITGARLYLTETITVLHCVSLKPSPDSISHRWCV